MKHYRIEQWVDYVRGLVAEPLRTEMTAHLNSQCESCQAMAQRLRATSAGLAGVDVPESFLARARAIFPPAGPRSSKLRALTALLTFDSLDSPLPQGVRTTAPAVRRLAYSIEDVRIELMIDPGKEKGAVVVTGQISTSAPDAASAKPRVRLMGRSATLQQTEASELGEFQLEFTPRPGLRLRILDTGGRRQIEIPLDLTQGRRRKSTDPGF